MNLSERSRKPTPKFFKVLRTIGLGLAGIGGIIVTAPVSLPGIVVTIGGYLTVAGGVLSGVSQLTVDEQPENGENEK